MLLTCLGGLKSPAASRLVPAVPVSSAATNAVAVPAPELTGLNWLNVAKGGSNAVPNFQGKVTILHFWTFDCINCRHNLPYYDRWQMTFDASRVQVLGIHTPETEHENDLQELRRKVKELRVTYPVLFDSSRENWHRWQVGVWPTVFLVDRRGRVRFAWEGELEYNHAGGYEKMTRLIRDLLNE